MSSPGRGDQIKVGLFVLAALVLLIVGSLWIAGSTAIRGRRVDYHVLLHDSSGLQAGDPVRFAGVMVGRIKQVNLRPDEPWPVELRIAIKPSLPVREDSSARVGTSGLMGTVFLELIAGSADALVLAPGATIRGEASPGFEEALAQLSQISDKVAHVLDQTAELLDEVSAEVGPILGQIQALLSEKNINEIEAILATLRFTLDESSPRLIGLLARLESVAEKADAGAERLPELTENLSGLGEDLRTALGPDGERLAGVLEAAEGSLTSADDVLSILGDNREEIEATLADLRDTVANLKAFSQQVKERPFSLVRIKAPPERKPGEDVKGGGK
jgi:phospholipid/cholesterol/gamma-HCH transport system substrate-binding protein